jgi:NDP-sugar pyrophosphorylase family protein
MDRQRLTITLSNQTLKRVDGVIDGTRIRNRSHAIEFLINQSLVPHVNQAVILAGGKGLHLRPYTFEMPKGLLPVGGKPILEHIVELLSVSGVRNIIFSIGHLGEKIKEHFGDGKKFGVQITYIDEQKEAGTGGALQLTKKYIKGDTFLVLHGDILINMNINELIAFHKRRETVGTIALTSVVDPSQFGEVVMNGNRITKFVEKPKKGEQTSQLINCGVYVFEKDIFDTLPKSERFQLEDVLVKLAKEKRLSGYLFGGRWIDVGTPQSYEKAIIEWGTK